MSEETSAQTRAQLFAMHSTCIAFLAGNGVLNLKLRLNAVVARMHEGKHGRGIQRGQNFHFQKIQCNSRYRKQNSELSNNLQRLEK